MLIQMDFATQVIPPQDFLFLLSERWRSGGGPNTPDENPEAQTRSGKAVVLVADDEPLIVRTLLEILRAEGYEAFGTKDGVEAVSQAQALKPDLLLLDISMPRLNGIEAARQIHSFSPQSRVVLFSGQASSTDLLHDAGIKGFKFEIVAKPVKPDVLMTMIRGMLE